MPRDYPPLTDFVGTPLQVGDLVAFSEATSTQQRFGQVTGFTEKSVRVRPIALVHAQTNLWGAYTPGGRRAETITRQPACVARLPENIQVFRHDTDEELSDRLRIPVAPVR